MLFRILQRSCSSLDISSSSVILFRKIPSSNANCHSQTNHSHQKRWKRQRYIIENRVYQILKDWHRYKSQLVQGCSASQCRCQDILLVHSVNTHINSLFYTTHYDNHNYSLLRFSFTRDLSIQFGMSFRSNTRKDCNTRDMSWARRI